MVPGTLGALLAVGMLAGYLRFGGFGVWQRLVGTSRVAVLLVGLLAALGFNDSVHQREHVA